MLNVKMFECARSESAAESKSQSGPLIFAAAAINKATAKSSTR